MQSNNRRDFLRATLTIGGGMALSMGAVGTEVTQEKPSSETFAPSGRRTNKRFRFGVLIETPETGRQLDPGYDEVIVPISKLVNPLEPNTTWPKMRDEIKSWDFPTRATSHFAETVRPLIGPDADFGLIRFFVQRAMARVSELGVRLSGVYGGFFKVPDGLSTTQAMDQCVRFVNMAADAAEPYGITIVLEPVGDPDTLWPLYVDAVKFAKRIARPNVRCMADTNYFLRRNEPLEVIKEDPEYCVHADTQGEGGQPGIGNRVDLHTQFFRVLRDIGYENCVSFACPWLDTSGTGSVDFRMESRKSLEYAKRIQDEVYSE